MTHSSFSRKKAGLSDNLHPFDNNKASLLTSRSFADIDDASYDTANVYVGHGNMRTVQSIGLIDDINECLLKNNPSNNYNFNTINKHVSNDDFKNCFSRHSCKNSGEDNCSGTITNKGQGKLIVTLADLKVWLSDQQRTDNFRNYLKSNSICTWALDFYIASTGLCRLSPNDSQVKPLFKAIFRRYMKKIPQIKEEIFDNTISQPHYHSDSEQRPAKSAISTQMSSLSEHGDDNHNTIQSGHDVSVKFPIQGDTLFEINSRISNKNINSSIFNTARSDVLSWLLPYFVDFKKYTHSSKFTSQETNQAYLSQTNPREFTRLLTNKLNEVISNNEGQQVTNSQYSDGSVLIDNMDVMNPTEALLDNTNDADFKPYPNKCLSLSNEANDLTEEMGCVDEEQLLDEHCARAFDRERATTNTAEDDNVISSLKSDVASTANLVAVSTAVFNNDKIEPGLLHHTPKGRRVVAISNDSLKSKADIDIKNTLHSNKRLGETHKSTLPFTTSSMQNADANGGRLKAMKNYSRSVIYPRNINAEYKFSTKKKPQRTNTLSALDSDVSRSYQHNRPVWRRQRSQTSLNVNSDRKELKTSLQHSRNSSHHHNQNLIKAEDSGILSMLTPSTLCTSSVKDLSRSKSKHLKSLGAAKNKSLVLHHNNDNTAYSRSSTLKSCLVSSNVMGDGVAVAVNTAASSSSIPISKEKRIAEWLTSQCEVPCLSDNSVSNSYRHRRTNQSQLQQHSPPPQANPLESASELVHKHTRHDIDNRHYYNHPHQQKQLEQCPQKAASSSVTVVYYLPGQDVPYMTQTQVVDINKITLAHLMRLVQCERSINCRYFFKVKTDLTENGIAYQEVSDPNAFVPLFENKIIAKLEKRD